MEPDEGTRPAEGEENPSSIIPLERIERHIYILRGHKVMLSNHLAELYGAKPKTLIQAVKRNLGRFPPDFMFQLTPEEVSVQRRPRKNSGRAR